MRAVRMRDRWFAVLLGVATVLAVSDASASAVGGGRYGPFVGGSPAVAWSSSLAADPNQVPPGQSSTLTATANPGVTNTSSWISIYDFTAGQYVALCGSGTVCTAVVSQNVAATHHYLAHVSAKPNPLSYPPPGILATSTDVAVTWSPIIVSLSANPTTVSVGGTTTLTAATNVDVGETPYSTEIYDATTSTLLGICPRGTRCTATATEVAATTHSFVAYVADVPTSYPPPNVQAISATSWVTWSNAGFTVTLTATPGAVIATATPPASPPPSYIEVFDETAGNRLEAICVVLPHFVTCPPASVVGHHYVAFVSSPSVDTTLPPAHAVAASAVVTGG